LAREAPVRLDDLVIRDYVMVQVKVSKMTHSDFRTSSSTFQRV
jgi:hypothetical protein